MPILKGSSGFKQKFPKLTLTKPTYYEKFTSPFDHPFFLLLQLIK